MCLSWDAQSSEQKHHKKGRFEKKDGVDLHTMIKSMVAKELKQAVSTLGKRKSDEADFHAIEVVDGVCFGDSQTVGVERP